MEKVKNNLSPLALSKSIHKISAWITPGILKELNKKLLTNKLDKSEFNTKSKIIADAIIGVYLSPDDFILVDKDIKSSKITFYLNQEDIQSLWDLEGYYLDKGIKRATISNIVTYALMEYLL